MFTDAPASPKNHLWPIDGIITNFDGGPRRQLQPGVMEGDPIFKEVPYIVNNATNLLTWRDARHVATMQSGK